MQNAPIPEDDDARIAALHSLSILDTEPEERFDRYTRLAKKMFDVPMVAISLVDRNRQWFKSRQGQLMDETPRDVSFCGHAIFGDAVFVVADATKDDRFSDNPLVIGNPGVRFYAGSPLPGPSGTKIGTICLMDNKPREFGADDREALADMAAMVASDLSALKLATIDDLTGLTNRRGFRIMASHALRMCGRYNLRACLAVLDMDQFKHINDRFGHAEGDAALIEFSREMLDAFRESDVIARLGGDEFCVLLTGSSKPDADVSLHRFGAAMARRNAQPTSRYELQFTSGIVQYHPTRHATIDDMIREADDTMYRKKNSRRNGR